MTDGARGEVRDVFRSEMKAAEKLETLVDEETPQDITEHSMDVAQEILDNVETPAREKYVYSTLFQIGRSINNEELAEFAGQKLQEWVNKHGK